MSKTMNLFSLDTLQFSKRLQKAGMNKKISEELAESIKDSVSITSEELATKNDINHIKRDILDVKKEINEIRVEIYKDLELMKKDIIIKLGSLMTIGVGIIAVLVKF